MKKEAAYPVILKPESDGSYFVVIPDFDAATQGESVADAMRMARDLIGIASLSMRDHGEEIPEPYSVNPETEIEDGDIFTLVDIDFEKYERELAAMLSE